MINKYDVGGFSESEIDTFSYNWLGATVQFKIFNTLITAIVRETDDVAKSITVEFENSGKLCIVTMAYQAAKKISNKE